jgi:hypothetical protein
MRRALTYIVVAALCIPLIGAERKSWSKVRYVGGTIPVKASRYDWNTTLTANKDSIVVVIAPAVVFTPQQTVRIKPSQVTSLSFGETAWRRVGEVNGAQLPTKAPALFGLLGDRGFFGIVYQTDDGKPAAILLDSLFTWRILGALKELTGKTIENSL